MAPIIPTHTWLFGRGFPAYERIRPTRRPTGESSVIPSHTVVTMPARAHFHSMVGDKRADSLVCRPRVCGDQTPPDILLHTQRRGWAFTVRSLSTLSILSTLRNFMRVTRVRSDAASPLLRMRVVMAGGAESALRGEIALRLVKPPMFEDRSVTQVGSKGGLAIPAGTATLVTILFDAPLLCKARPPSKFSFLESLPHTPVLNARVPRNLASTEPLRGFPHLPAVFAVQVLPRDSLAKQLRESA